MNDILLHKKIYKKKHLLKAAKAFGELADVQVKKDGDYYRVSMALKESGFEEVIQDEFCNYAICEMKSGIL